MDRVKQTLQEHFGFTDFRPGQAETIDALLNGKNVLSVLPTGAGKSLIYQLYGYLINQPIVIVSPLLSLMDDQVARMNYLGEKAVVALNSNHDWHEKQQIISHLDQYHYIFISPEMLTNQVVMQQLKQINIGLFVIDEAHCISKWGVDFRPDYLGLKNVIAQLKNPQVLMLTATASNKVQHDVLEKLNLQNVVTINEPVNRPNIYLAAQKFSDEKAKQDYLLSFLKQVKKPGIVYFSSKKVANMTADLINESTGIKAAAYHADLSKHDRFKIQHQFMDNDLQVICATNAFGMGIDKNDINFVVHYHLPQDMESYVQEIGRAGRNGQPSIALLLYADGDEQLTANLIDSSFPSSQDFGNYQQHAYWKLDEQVKRLLDFYFQHGFNENQIKQVFAEELTNKEAGLQRVINYLNESGCRRQTLLANFDEVFTDLSDKCCDFGTGECNLANLNLQSHDERQVNKLNSWQNIIDGLF